MGDENENNSICSCGPCPSGSSAVRAEEPAASPRAEGARFAAMSLTDAQGARAIISNVLATANVLISPHAKCR